jgi:hypothetical protein
MRYPVLFGTTLLLAACAQRYAAPANSRSSAAPQDAFECVKRQMNELGYKQTAIDVDERRIIGTKVDLGSRRADTQFRRMLNRLEVEVAPHADGQTSIEIRGRTFAEYTTHRGPTEVEETASTEVKEATRQILDRCRG